MKGDRPGKKKSDLKVKDDEEDGNKVKANVKPSPCIVKGIKPTFIGRDLLRICLLSREDKGQAEDQYL